LLVSLTIFGVAAFGWILGVVLALVVTLGYGAVAQKLIIRRQSRRLYERYETRLLAFLKQNQRIFRFIRRVIMQPVQLPRLSSREELEHIVRNSTAVLTKEEIRLFLNGLQFGRRLVSEVMIPRSVIDSIDKGELLGPLVLDDLHKTGHSRFPVVDGDTDHVIGVLHVQDLLTLDKKRSVTAGKAMEPRVYYIREDQNLQHALAAFLRTRHHLFIVVNEFQETVGIISLEDVIEALLGRKIIDEFDAHDDLRAVAARNPRDNNRPEKREDV